MKKGCIQIIILTACLNVLLGSCTSTSIRKSERTEKTFTPFQQGNRLISYGIGISLPTGWNFFFPEEDDLLLSFVDAENNYRGCLEWCPVGFSLSEKELLKFFENKMLENIIITKILRNTVSSDAILILECKSEVDNITFYFSLIPDDFGFYVLELQASETSDGDLLNICIGISSSIREEPLGMCRRTVSGIYDFHDLKGIWNWVGDISGGGIFYRFLPGYMLCVATVMVTEENNLDSMFPESENYFHFEDLVYVNNREMAVMAASRNLDTGTEVYVLLNGNINYIVHIAYRDESNKIDGVELFSKPEIRKFFLANITFEGLSR